jgi:flagellar assembly protein FliH
MPLSGPSAVADGSREKEAQAREKRAWDLGFQQGQTQARAESEKTATQRRETLAQALRDFAGERHTYYQRVETEVVQLALAIARKILHREAQIDPLLLAGVVRVALEKVATGTGIRLRVHPSQVDVWRKFFDHQADLQPIPELLGDASLATDQSVLETTLGSTELTLQSQLKEIEQGFFDLLAHRPV